MTCHQLGFDAEVGHVEMWTAVIDRLAAAWDKDAAVLRRLLRDRYYGLLIGIWSAATRHDPGIVERLFPPG